MNKVEFHKISKSRDKPTFDEFGRAMKFHQSPHDLRLSLGSSVAIDDTSHTLLSLWWQPAGGCRLTKEQESLAQAVFFDLVEAVHAVPPHVRCGLQRCLWRAPCCCSSRGLQRCLWRCLWPAECALGLGAPCRESERHHNTDCCSGSADRESCADTAKPWHMAHDGCWKAGT